MEENFSQQNINTVFPDYIMFINELYHLTADNLSSCFNSLNLCINKYQIPLHTIAKMIDQACELHHPNFISYVSLLEQFHEKYNYNFKNYRFQFGKLCEYIRSKYGIVYIHRENKQENIQEGIQFVFDIHEEEIINFIVRDDFKSLQKLIDDKSIDIQQQINGKDLLSWSALYGSLSCFKFFHCNGIEIQQSTLESAFIGGDFEIIQICEQIVKPTKRCIENAVKAHNNEGVYYLMEKYDLSYSFRTAALSFNFELFCHKIYITGKRDNAIAFSVFFGVKEFVEYLIDSGADIGGVSGPKKKSALHYAAEHDFKDIASYLLSKNADIDKKDKTSMNPLMLSAMNDCYNVAKILLENGAKTDEMDRSGRTALQWCAWMNSTAVARLLLEKNVNPSVLCKNTTNLIDIAQLTKAYDFIKVLEEFQSKQKKQ